LSGIIERCFKKNMRTEAKLAMHNIIAKPALQYGSEIYVLKGKYNRT
jgi:hypothetical protein